MKRRVNISSIYVQTELMFQMKMTTSGRESSSEYTMYVVAGKGTWNVLYVLVGYR